jgi:hypothetical protein
MAPTVRSVLVTGLYYVELIDVLRAAGCAVGENGTTDGWQTRARSSGGFPAPPLGVWWHHTASSTSPANDLGWMIDGSDDAPIGNLLLDRTGVFWPIAAGASNCAGKGGPATFSRGECPADSGNTRGFQIEVANDGVGEPWPSVQVDAFFAGSNALNALVGNLPTDLITHAAYAPDRKIDPATAAAVQGPWQPRASTSSGTWDLDDIRAECATRAGAAPTDPNGDDEMTDDQANELHAAYLNSEWTWQVVQDLQARVAELERIGAWNQDVANEQHATYLIVAGIPPA